MKEFFSQCVDMYCELSGLDRASLRKAGTPFLPEDHKESPAARPQDGAHMVECTWCRHTFNAPPPETKGGAPGSASLPQAGHAGEPSGDHVPDAQGGAGTPTVSPGKGLTSYRDAVVGATAPAGGRRGVDEKGRPVKIARKKKHKPKATCEGWGGRDPYSTEPVDDEQGGVLQPIAARVLMKVLYGARMARFDLLRAVCHLACFVTKWSETCDRRLHRLMCYINSTLDFSMHGWVGDDLAQCQPH